MSFTECGACRVMITGKNGCVRLWVIESREEVRGAAHTFCGIAAFRSFLDR